MAFDPSGNMWATGWFQNQVNFGGNLLDATGDQGDRDVFVAKFGPTGNHLASANFGGLAFEQAIDIAAAPNGDVAIVGYTEGEMNFGAGTIPNNQGRRAFAARLTTNADQVFADIFEGSGEGTAVSTTFDDSGDLNITVIVSEYIGNQKNIIADLGGEKLTIVTGADTDVDVGATYRIKVNASKLHLFDGESGLTC